MNRLEVHRKRPRSWATDYGLHFFFFCKIQSCLLRCGWRSPQLLTPAQGVAQATSTIHDGVTVQDWQNPGRLRHSHFQGCPSQCRLTNPPQDHVSFSADDRTTRCRHLGDQIQNEHVFPTCRAHTCLRFGSSVPWYAQQLQKSNPSTSSGALLTPKIRSGV